MKNNISSVPFNTILSELMNQKHLTSINVVDLCKKRNIYQSVRNINRYKNGEVVPPLNIAIDLLNCLNEKVDVNDLKMCLLLSKKQQEEIMYQHKKSTLRKKVSITYDEFNLKNINEDIIKILIENRLAEIYPNNKKAFSYYVRDLISKDLQKNVLNSKEKNK